jgi:adenine-specific DNA-methyltransferase
MKKIEVNDTETQSADIVADNLLKLKTLFPEAFSEGKIQFETLRQLLGDAVDESDEKYGLNWHGKRRARQIALTPSTGTLRPCPEESVDWDTTQNLMIEGDNLEVLKLLQKSYAGRVKLIYIDPPYNTGKDFVYPDNFRDSITNYLELTGQVEAGIRMNANMESSGRFHTDWLNMMYPRLRLARSLLRDDGVIFITIDDAEQANLRKIGDEVFGEENFVANIIWQKKYAVANDDPGIGAMHDHILVWRKSESFQRGLLPRTEEQNARYSNPDNDARGEWASDNYVSNKSKDERPTLWYSIKHPKTGEDVWPDESAVWRYSVGLAKPSRPL